MPARDYFYGYKVHLITAADGRIVEYEFSPGACDDRMAFGSLGFDLATGSEGLPIKSTTLIRLKKASKKKLKSIFNPFAKPIHVKPITAICLTD